MSWVPSFWAGYWHSHAQMIGVTIWGGAPGFLPIILDTLTPLNVLHFLHRSAHSLVFAPLVVLLESHTFYTYFPSFFPFLLRLAHAKLPSYAAFFSTCVFVSESPCIIGTRTLLYPRPRHPPYLCVLLRLWQYNIYFLYTESSRTVASVLWDCTRSFSHALCFSCLPVRSRLFIYMSLPSILWSALALTFLAALTSIRLLTLGSSLLILQRLKLAARGSVTHHYRSDCLLSSCLWRERTCCFHSLSLLLSSVISLDTYSSAIVWLRSSQYSVFIRDT